MKSVECSVLFFSLFDNIEYAAVLKKSGSTLRRRISEMTLKEQTGCSKNEALSFCVRVQYYTNDETAQLGLKVGRDEQTVQLEYVEEGWNDISAKLEWKCRNTNVRIYNFKAVMSLVRHVLSLLLCLLLYSAKDVEGCCFKKEPKKRLDHA